MLGDEGECDDGPMSGNEGEGDGGDEQSLSSADEGARGGVKRPRLRFSHVEALGVSEQKDGTRLAKKMREYSELLQRLKAIKEENSTGEQETQRRYNDMLGQEDRLEKMRRHFDSVSDELAIAAVESLARAVAAELRLEALQRENEKLRLAFPTAEQFGELGKDVKVLKIALAEHRRVSQIKEAHDRECLEGFMRRTQTLQDTYGKFITQSEALTQRAEGHINAAAGPRGTQGAGGSAIDAALVMHDPPPPPPSQLTTLTALSFSGTARHHQDVSLFNDDGFGGGVAVVTALQLHPRGGKSPTQQLAGRLNPGGGRYVRGHHIHLAVVVPTRGLPLLCHTG